MRLVRVPVVDRREHRHLAGVVELAQAGQTGMPAEAGRVAQRQRGSRVQADARAQLRIPRVADRGERIEAVVAAVEVERDEDRRVGRVGGLRCRRFQQATRREAGHATGRQQQADAAGEQIAPGEPAALELRQAVECTLGDRDEAPGAAVQRGAGAVPVAAASGHQQTCASGPASSTWRNTRSRSGQ